MKAEQARRARQVAAVLFWGWCQVALVCGWCVMLARAQGNPSGVVFSALVVAVALRNAAECYVVVAS